MRYKTNSIMDEIRNIVPVEIKIKTELSVAIANRIYQSLEQRGLTQKDFAKMMGKTETEVSRWLSGTHNLTISTIAKISSVLGEEIILPTNIVSRYSVMTSMPKRYLSDIINSDSQRKE